MWRIEFTDGTDELLRSDNEPDPLGYFRFGGWRQRKLEDYLAFKTPDELPGDDELPLWEVYAPGPSCAGVQRSSRRLPNAGACRVRLRRVFTFPEPSQKPIGP